MKSNKEAWNTYKSMLIKGEINADTFALLTADLSPGEFCSCGVCLNSLCSSSDSKLAIAKCWCAACKDTRKEIKANAYSFTIVKGE